MTTHEELRRLAGATDNEHCQIMFDQAVVLSLLDEIAALRSDCLLFSNALVDILDGTQGNTAREIHSLTGLPDDHCERIAATARIAIAMLEDMK